jgi:hypothetical protein
MHTNRYSKRNPPVLLITFNRPELTARLLKRIKAARPPVLYVACDGPRAGRKDDQEKIERIQIMVDAIDWCETVKTKFQSKNLGCGRGESEAMTWFLNDAGEGIILEDDTLPDLTFFQFCGEMLDRYRETTNIMQISGYNYLSGRYDTDSDYLFSQGGFSWAWATWERAWKFYDFKMKSWPEFKKLGYHRLFPFTPRSCNIFDDMYSGKIDTWDYQWNFIRTANSGLSVVPKFNLVENIGFGVDATHGASKEGAKPYMVPVRPMSFPVSHPKFLCADNYYDQMLVRMVEGSGVRNKIKRTISNLVHRYPLAKQLRDQFRLK